MRSFTPLTKASKALSYDAVMNALVQLQGWQLTNTSGRIQIVCHYQFDNFNQSMAFANAIATFSDHFDHHPTLLVKWGCVDVHWYTYQLDGVHENDLFMAAQCDAIFGKLN